MQEKHRLQTTGYRNRFTRGVRSRAWMGCTQDASFEVASGFLVRHLRVLRDGELASESTLQASTASL